MNCYEVVVSHAYPDADREAILTVSRELQSWVIQQPGFLRRTLLEAGEGTWIDIVLWETEAAAKTAAAAFPPDCGARFAALFDMTTMKMMHGTEVPL
ncbi:MAG TPA: hypothetical protein VF618_15950 [Thermoanaerobaculia bacterium]